MKKIQIICLLLVLISPAALLNAQSIDSMAVHYYILGKNAVLKNDLETAKDLFKKSVKEEDNAPAEFELANIYKADTSHAMWNISREHIKNAVALEPDNVTYRIFYGKLSEALYKMSRLEFQAEDDAIKQYETALQLDSSNIYASKRLGELKSKEFLEYNNSVEKFSDGTDLLGSTNNVQKTLNNRILGKTRSQQQYELQNIADANLNEYVEKDFKYAEKALINTIKYDSLNPEPYLKLGSIYEDNNQPAKGIKHLQHLTRLFPGNKDAHLELGLLYSRTNRMDSSYYEYQKAIALMSSPEKEDFVYNSVRVLIKPFLGSKMENLNENTLKQIISIFWKARDPLNITPYNERLLEHYTRVAYSNLRFSVPDLGIKGWKTDRGITVIRYGIPPKRIKFRPGMRGTDVAGKRDVVKTDVWIYNDKTFSFTDEFRNGNFIYSKPSDTQYFGDSQEFASDLLATQPEEYIPVFEGPKFNIPYKPVQFNNYTNNGLTDLFICYAIKPESNPDKNINLNFRHTFGIFFFDRFFNVLSERKDSVNDLSWKNIIEIPDSGTYFVNTEELISKPDSGNISFEILRNSDKGIASYHGHYRIRNFNTGDLILSSILLASDIQIGLNARGRIKRKDYSILPNPMGIFSDDSDLYIYYEVYNLRKDKEGLTNFQQNIILQRKNEDGVLGKIFSPVLKFIGINNNKQVSLTSNYQTNDKDSQVYLQLDMGDYDAGNYVLTVRITDNVSGRKTEQSTDLTWE